jgi:hypothetical protein
MFLLRNTYTLLNRFDRGRLPEIHFRGNMFEELIQDTGPEVVRLLGGNVYFRDPESGVVLSLYCFACNDVKNGISFSACR